MSRIVSVCPQDQSFAPKMCPTFEKLPYSLYDVFLGNYKKLSVHMTHLCCIEGMTLDCCCIVAAMDCGCPMDEDCTASDWPIEGAMELTDIVAGIEGGIWALVDRGDCWG